METVLFYIFMVLFGSAYAVVFFSPSRIANTSLAAKHPLLGVLTMFCMLGALYWLLVMAEKNIWNAYFGFLVLAISYGFAKEICKEVNRKKQ